MRNYYRNKEYSFKLSNYAKEVLNTIVTKEYICH